MGAGGGVIRGWWAAYCRGDWVLVIFSFILVATLGSARCSNGDPFTYAFKAVGCPALLRH